MQTVLVVTEPFDGHDRGAIIDDPVIIGDVLASEHAAHVVQIKRAETQAE